MLSQSKKCLPLLLMDNEGRRKWELTGNIKSDSCWCNVSTRWKVRNSCNTSVSFFSFHEQGLLYIGINITAVSIAKQPLQLTETTISLLFSYVVVGEWKTKIWLLYSALWDSEITEYWGTKSHSSFKYLYKLTCYRSRSRGRLQTQNVSSEVRNGKFNAKRFSGKSSLQRHN